MKPRGEASTYIKIQKWLMFTWPLMFWYVKNSIVTLNDSKYDNLWLANKKVVGDLIYRLDTDLFIRRLKIILSLSVGL